MSKSGTAKNNILSELVKLINEITDFKQNVFKGFRTRIIAPKAVLIHLLEDLPIQTSTEEIEHSIVFNMLVQKKADIKANAEEEMEDFIELVGKVEDKISENTYKEGLWENLRIDRINYTFFQAETFIRYNALVRVEARAQW